MTTEPKIWTAAGSWLGRTLVEPMGIEALAASAVSVGFSREQLNAAANEIRAAPMRSNVGVWQLDYQVRPYWSAYRDGFDAASGRNGIATSKAHAPEDTTHMSEKQQLSGQRLPLALAPASARRHETSAEIFERRRGKVQAARSPDAKSGHTD